MKLPNTQTLRLLLLAAYLAALILFCSLGAWLAYRHYRFADASAALYAERIAADAECRSALDHASHAAFQLRAEPESESAFGEMIRRSDELLQAALPLNEVYPENGTVSELLNKVRQVRKDAESPAKKDLLEPLLSSISDSLRIIERQTGGDLAVRAVPDGGFFFRTILYAEIFVILFALLLLAGYGAISAQIRRSLQTLRDGTKALRTGNLTYRFKEVSPDEIGQVKYDFNIMARR